MIFNSPWLGYAGTPDEAIRIIQETGAFYLAISVAFLLSFAYMVRHSEVARKMKGTLLFGIFMWAFFGYVTLYQTNFAGVINTLVVLLSLIVLAQLQFTSPLLAVASVSDANSNTDDKKVMYAKTMLAKRKLELRDFLAHTLINELILWLLILYRAIVALRADFAF